MNLRILLAIWLISSATTIISAPTAAQAFNHFETDQSNDESAEKKELIQRCRRKSSPAEVPSFSLIDEKKDRLFMATIRGSQINGLRRLCVWVMAGQEEAYYPHNEPYGEHLTDLYTFDLTGDVEITSVAMTKDVFTVTVEDETQTKKQILHFTVKPTSLWQWYRFHKYDQELVALDAESEQIKNQKDRSCPCVIM